MIKEMKKGKKKRMMGKKGWDEVFKRYLGNYC